MASGKTKEMRSVKKQEKKGPNMRKTKGTRKEERNVWTKQKLYD